jgi:hypothetical protein
MRSLLTLTLFCTAVFGAENPFLGTWKLNTAKSESNPTPLPKSMTVKFEAEGNKVRRTATGIDAEGKPIMQGGPKGSSIEWDGKDHAVEGPPGAPQMSVAVKRIDDYTNAVTIKQGGKVITTVRSVVSKDGKTMTNTLDGVDEKGRKVHGVEVLEKQ